MNEMKENNSIKEFYTSLSYNYLIAKGFAVHAFASDEYFSFGTPAELKEAINSFNE
jgi:hypothetical protein